MASDRRIPILIISRNKNWEQPLQQSLKNYADYIQLFVSDSIPEIVELCLIHKFQTVIGDPFDPNCVSLLPLLNRMPSTGDGRQFLFLTDRILPPPLVSTYAEYKNIIFLTHPCSTIALVKLITAPISGKNMQYADDICKAKLEYWKIPRMNLGWSYIRKAALSYFTNPRQTMDAIYREIADEEHTSPENVSSAIRNAIISASAKSDRMKSFGKSGHPTNKQLICQLYDEITRRLSV